MTRRIRETFHGPDLPQVWVEVDGITYTGEMRATAVDDDPATNQGDSSWVLVQWPRSYERTLLDWFPAAGVRLVAHLSDDDSRVVPDVARLAGRRVRA